MASIFAPVLYLILVVGGLGVFSYFYRKRTANQRLEPYFGTHQERNTYVTLLSQANPPASDALLKSALIRRAMEDVRRAMRIREDKPALQNLLQKGSVGDDIWNSLLAAEKELEAEVLEVMHEANSFMPGWGQFIFASVSEMVNNERMKKMFDDIPKLRAELESKFKPKKKKKAIASEPAKSEKPSSSMTELPPQATEPNPATPPQTNGSNCGLAPPSTTDVESITSMSDGELVSSPGSPSTPSKSPSKKAGKKGKKRK